MANPLKQIEAGVLNIGYRDSGPADGPVAILIHGVPYDIHAYDAVEPILNGEGFRTITPFMRGYGTTRFRDPAAMRSGEQAAFGADLKALMDALGIKRAVLGGYDWGGRAASVAAALWPERVIGLVSCGTGYNIQDIAKSVEPAKPAQEHRFWYQYYFHTERGRTALQERRGELCRYIWEVWSPTWRFTDEDFKRSAASFDNPDFVDVVIHSYRHRYGVVDGDPAYAEIEAQLAAQPAIAVPSIVLLGADDGVDPPSATDDAAKHYTGPYRREIVPGVGHNFPQEAPAVFAQAMVDVARLSA